MRTPIKGAGGIIKVAKIGSRVARSTQLSTAHSQVNILYKIWINIRANQPVHVEMKLRRVLAFPSINVFPANLIIIMINQLRYSIPNRMIGDDV